MANPEHLEILKQGVKKWNKWREDNPDIEPDLSGIDFSKEDSFYMSFEPYNFSKTIFLETNLSGFNFSGSDFTKAIFSEVTPLVSIAMKATFEKKTNLAKNSYIKTAKLLNTVLNGADLTEAYLNGVDLTKAQMDEANLTKAQLNGVDLTEAHLYGATLSKAIFTRSNLISANFRDSIVDGDTLISNCKINKETDFRGVGLDNARIDSGIKELLKLNIRRLNWEDWYKDHKIAKWPTKLFWNFSNYGSSTLNLIAWFFLSASFFALIYFCWPDMIEGLIKKNCNIVGACENIPNKYSLFLFFRGLYFSIVTMTTLGFGDMHANINSGWGYFWLMFQVLLGYFLLGALITRLSVLFTGEGPAGKFYKDDEGK